MKQRILLNVNGTDHKMDVEPSESLNTVIRERLGLIGTKKGCDTGGCGACTVLVDERAVYSCMMYAAYAHGKRILTIEGISGDKGLHPIQEAFMKLGALQCGFCTPGIILAAKALLDANPRPSEEEVRDALVGNLCRCTGYVKIIEAVLSPARERSREKVR